MLDPENPEWAAGQNSNDDDYKASNRCTHHNTHLLETCRGKSPSTGHPPMPDTYYYVHRSAIKALLQYTQSNSLGGSWSIAGNTYQRGYLLADGIYPDWPIFLKTISQPQTVKEKLYSQKQESVRKDVARAFGILQACWKIVVEPCRMWDDDTMHSIMQTCIILHNMRIESRQFATENEIEEYLHLESSAEIQFNRYEYVGNLISDRTSVKNAGEYYQLRDDIMNHLWITAGDSVELTH